MNGNRFNKSPPVHEGDEVDVKIEAIGDKGDGIARKDGFVLVVPGTQVNDEVRVVIKKVLRKVGFAEVVSRETSAGKEEAESTDDEERSDEPDENHEEDNDEDQSSDDEPKGKAGRKKKETEESEDSEDFGEDE